MQRTMTFVGSVAAALMVAAAPVSAAETVGSDLSGTVFYLGAPAGQTFTGVDQVAGSNLPMAATAPGVIVEIKMKHSVAPATATGGWSLLSGTYPNFTARTSPLLPDITWQNGQAAGIRSFTTPPDANGGARGAPIAAGERLAYRTITGTSPAYEAKPTIGGSWAAVGTDHRFGQQAYPFLFPNEEALVNMRIEPDADGDTYGDETQDFCLGTAGPVYGCSASAVIKGTRNRDVIQGTPGDDLIVARGGNDTVHGNGGNDVIFGGSGKDKLFGDAGDDRLYGEANKDKCVGGLGADEAKNCEKTRSL